MKAATGSMVMVKKILLISCVFCLTTPAFALRCGNKLVKEGDYTIDVIHKCGDPDYVSEWVEYHFEASNFNYHTLGDGRKVPILIEEWTYNFGPRRLMRRLRFKKGKLEKIDTLNYGFRKNSRN